MTRRLGILIGASLVALALIAPGTATAGERDKVDPAIMQPVLNPDYAPWDCWRNGAGITCQGQSVQSYSNIETPLVCDGKAMYVTGTDVRSLDRHGDADGLALWTTGHEMFDETWTLQPDGSGPALHASGRFESMFLYSTPGDRSTRTERQAGITLMVDGPGVGLVFHNVGVWTQDIDGNPLLVHGPHPLIDDFLGTFGKVCDAFAKIGA
jgi:hypothetical protein